MKLWRYTLPNENHEGWAIFVIGADGYFSAVSDYGNYAYIWRDTGCSDFREFLLRADRDWDYFASKLAPEKVYDGEQSAENVRKAILQMRRDGRLSFERAKEEWALFNRSEFGQEFSFFAWYQETGLDDAGEYASFKTRGEAVAFVNKCMVRLIPLLKADLEKEESCQSEAK